MGKGLRELGTKEKLGGKSDGALTATTINGLQKYYRRAIVNNTYEVSVNNTYEVTSTVPARGARTINRAISNSCL